MRKALLSPRTLFELGLIVAIVLTATRQPPNIINQRWSQNVVYRVPTAEKAVALTYDDGPDPRFTPKILDILDKYNVKATFFMVGRRMDAYPEIAKDVLRRGHAIGNHTYDHPRDIEADTSAQVIRELEKCEEIIERLTGSRAHLFRPPRGLIDGVVFSIAQEEGYRTILWSVCADHHDAYTPEMMAARVLKRVRPGSIILAHDGTFGTRWKDVVATPMIIEGLRKRGYRFVTVPELLKLGARSEIESRMARNRHG